MTKLFENGHFWTGIAFIYLGMVARMFAWIGAIILLYGLAEVVWDWLSQRQ